RYVRQPDTGELRALGCARAGPRQIHPRPLDDRPAARRRHAHELCPLFVLHRRGAAVWIGAALLAGLLLKSQIARLLPRLSGIGGTVVVILIVLLGAYVAFKWWERKRFYALLDMARINVDELSERMRGDTAPVIVDVRSPTSLELERRRIPGALSVPVQEVERQVRSLPRDREI